MLRAMTLPAPRRGSSRRSTTRVSPATRRALRERALGCCEVCGVHGATNAHHRVNASQGGRPTLGNLMLVCGSGTTGCHGRITTNPSWARAHGYSVGGTFEPCDVAALRWSRWTGAAEWVLLDDRGGITPTERVRPK
ncbi:MULTISPECIES: HNH endonuclease signature motif containing protein [unclassified Mycobacterium]|uniref:HNH endonuclease n=1 Tax=unclassified Mycobacterium TaxID=2642494 RepID=UPI0029C7EB35|nr:MULTISPECIES: HNH endonuclease signature motif containing protein [unclassified Mycobacterium]